MNLNLYRIFALLLVVFVVAGCRAQATQSTGNLDITLEPPTTKTGQVTLTLIVKDPQGRPVDNAKLDIVGDMTHAGMTPVNGKIEGGKDGRYSVPFEWTMGGDWILTVKATLPDGSVTTKTFNLSIAS
jgi:uncharacterized protein (DUF2141 family)